jgi:hypothetical protein
VNPDSSINTMLTMGFHFWKYHSISQIKMIAKIIHRDKRTQIMYTICIGYKDLIQKAKHGKYI